MEFIQSIDKKDLSEAPAIVAPYKILSHSMRLIYIKNELSFLTDKEADNVKQYIDYIVEYAGL